MAAHRRDEVRREHVRSVPGGRASPRGVSGQQARAVPGLDRGRLCARTVQRQLHLEKHCRHTALSIRRRH